MHNSKIKQISLAVCLALMPFVAEAAGLGKLTVLSGLGEPFNAEIELSAGKDEIPSLSARIASTEIYAEHGIERISSLGSVRVELAKKPDGSPVLRLSTAHPVNDPFLDMLIQVDWPTGRLLREYTALLDPPGYGSNAPTPMSGAELATSTRDLSKKNTDKRASSVEKASVRTLTEPEKIPPVTDYRTKSGDTLRGVARKMQVRDVSLEQMLAGLYRANRDAFMQENMNQLKVGKIIHAPKEDSLRSISQHEAVEEVRLHASNWNAYRSRLADAAAHAAPAEDAPAQQTSAGKITAAADDKAAAPVPAGPRDVVKLSKSEAASSHTGTAEVAGSVAADKLKALEEESTAQENAIKDVSERIAIFEKQIQDMQKLLVVQNQMLAELQKGAANAPATPFVDMPAEVPAKAEKPAVKRVAMPEDETSDISSLISRFVADPLMLAGSGLLVLLGGAWVFMRNRRKKGLDSFERGILSSGGVKADTVFGEKAEGDADNGKTSFMADFAQHTGGDMIDTSDVDPISEADVYMAYGRDAQAEEILKDAIAKEPKRYELHQKLLDIYAARKNTGAFETLAGELYATLGASNSIWLGVAALGRTFDPDNPMYAEGTARAEAESLDAVVAAESEPTAEVAAEQVEETAVDDNSLDFDLGALAEDVPAPESESVPEDAAVSESQPEPEPEEETVAELKLSDETPDEDAGLNFEFELPEPAVAGNVQLGADELGMEEPGTLPELPDSDADEEEVAVELELPEADLAEEELAAELVLPDEDLFAPAETSAEDASAEAVTVEEATEPSLDMPELAEQETPVAETLIDETEDETTVAESEVLVDALDETSEPPELAPEMSEQDVSEDLEGISFDEPELELPTEEPASTEVDKTTSSTATDELEAEINALDVSFDLPVEDALSAQETPVESEPDLTDFPTLGPAKKSESASVDEEIVLQAPPAEEGDLDFNFDLDVGAEATPEAPPQKAAQPLPDLDLAGINLDISESASVDSGASEEITLSGPESSDVDTKLDLVTAYLDMGDAEGARELLDEVMQEGGPQQCARAQKLLDSLG